MTGVQLWQALENGVSKFDAPSPGDEETSDAQRGVGLQRGVGEQARHVPLVQRIEDVVRLADDGDLVERVRTDDDVCLLA